MRWPLATGAAPRLLAIGLLAAAAGWLATTSLQQDFAAYYTAGASARLRLDPYLNHLATPGGPWDGIGVFRHSRFLYPPLVAELFRPLAALPFAVAKGIFTVASLAALVVGLGLVARDVAAAASAVVVGGGGGGAETGTAGLTARIAPLLCAVWLPVWLPVWLTLERGQIDLLLLVPLAAAWHWRRQPLLAGAALAAAAMGKPAILAVVPILICGRRWRWAAATVGAVAILAAANLAVCGRLSSEKYLREVLPRAARYGEGGTAAMLLGETELSRAAADWSEGVARIDGQGRAYDQQVGTFARSASLPRLLAGDDQPSMLLALVAYVILGAALAIGARRSPGSGLWYWGAMLTAVVVAPVSWAMSLVWALPVFLWIWLGPEPGPGPGQQRRRVMFTLAVVAFVAGMLGPISVAVWVLAGLAAVAAAVAATI